MFPTCVRGAGFTVTQVEHAMLPKTPKFVSPTIIGSARTPAHLPSSPVPLATFDRG